ncbi:uncharacterized protein K02A2.6-like [Teleopsis dalmanni]|uniref:uncharacterized protein K02A2.6-like n=1 Tax=Teleopsis dalmanni TaxID=139649 RepID=UPI0018CD110F|nr:uncharacterized protein K02A2.6-like [Teleopsis dalmanni]
MSTHRLQRWAITLMSYQFEIQFRRTADHSNADALSRLPCGPDPEFDRLEHCYQIENYDTLINVGLLQQHYKDDYILKRVKNLISEGWRTKLADGDMDLLPYFRRKYALFIRDDLIYLQTDATRVIVPQSLHQSVLKLLHDGHWGIVKMKQLARQHCWWPNIDNDIEKLASQCSVCQIAGSSPKQKYHEWPKPERPWQRVHIDFAGPVFQSMWLIVVDAFSQFPFVVQLKTITTIDTIAALSAVFSLEGLPETIVSDNGPQLTSDQSAEYCARNGISHVKTAPFHPASNGLAERFVRTFKSSVQKNIDDGLSIKLTLVKYLATYRAIPNAKGKSPAELLHGRAPRTVLTLLSAPPNNNKPVTRSTKFSPNETVYIKHYGRGPKWVEAVIIKNLGCMVYIVKTSNGYVRRHQNQIKHRSSTSAENNSKYIL